MLEDLWTAILDLTAKFVIPDWGSLIALIPVGLLIVVSLWLLLLVRRFASAGPTRRGKRRITPVPPPGIHMPGPSMAPVLVAIGAALAFWGLVVGGWAIVAGLTALVLSLLAWGAEGLRDYDHLGDDASAVERLPAAVHQGPPPGVHMPGPSFRPFLAALGATVLFFGLVFGGWLLVAGVVVIVATLVGWLLDARREYVKTVEADETGHLENLPAPDWPRRTLGASVLLVALALLVDAGILPPASDTAAGGQPPAATSPAPGGGGGTPSSPPAGPSYPPGDLVVVAEGIQFTTRDLSVAGPDFTIVFDNRDQAPHDVDILAGGSKVFDSEPFTGPKVEVLEVREVAAGSYEFICSIHPNMTGTITVQ